jgi:small subunit ribosomal protein S19e
MATMYDVPASDLVDALAVEFADHDDIQRPDWIEFVKSGAAAELPPEQDDFWERRTASLLRKVAADGPVGVKRLSTEYGGAKQGSNRYRVAPAHRADGSRKIVRTALTQLEDAGLVLTADGEGRRVTPAGKSLLDETADDVVEDLDRDDLQRYA